MPLPPALQARLTKRGIISADSETSSEERRGCPNRSNPYHQCSTYCVERWGKPPANAPLSLPAPWKAVLDKTSGDTYFWNPDTKATSWERPIPDDGIVNSSSNVEKTNQNDVANSNKDTSRRTLKRHPEDDDTKDIDPDDPFVQQLQSGKKRPVATTVAEGTIISDKEVEHLPGSGIIRHETCWKCGKKNPLPDGICARCAGNAIKKQTKVAAAKKIPMPPPSYQQLMYPPRHHAYRYNLQQANPRNSSHPFQAGATSRLAPPIYNPYTPPPPRPPGIHHARQAGLPSVHSGQPLHNAVRPVHFRPFVPAANNWPQYQGPGQAKHDYVENDPMDPSSYSDVARGNWGTGLPPYGTASPNI